MGWWFYINHSRDPYPCCLLSEVEEKKRSSERRQLTWNGSGGGQPRGHFPKMLSETWWEGFTRDGCGESHGDINDGCTLKCIGAGRALLSTCPPKSLSGMPELHGTEKTKIGRTWRWLFSQVYSPLSTLKACSLQASLDPLRTAKLLLWWSLKTTPSSKPSGEAWPKQVHISGEIPPLVNSYLEMPS